MAFSPTVMPFTMQLDYYIANVITKAWNCNLNGIDFIERQILRFFSIFFEFEKKIKFLSGYRFYILTSIMM